MLSSDQTVPIHWHRRGPPVRTEERQRARRVEALRRINALLTADATLARRFERVVTYQHGLHASEYHLTNACNIRCKGCWFFEAGLDASSRELTDLNEIEAFVRREAARKVNLALVIGGEPALFPRRLALFVKHMRHVTISTNGLKKLPVEGFEDVCVGVSVWGGGPMDDELRAIKPGGSRFEGLFESALANYENDRRALFVYAVTESGIAHIEPTVRRIRDNGNAVIFNFYSDYGAEDPIPASSRDELIDEMLRVRELYPSTVISHPYFIRAIVTGQSHWGEFGYDTCPSVSQAHPAHAERLRNGHPTLPLFNTFAADMETITFCCTSGRCSGCRDSQAMGTWLLINMHQFTDNIEQLRTWVELAESWWAQFCWSPYHRLAATQAQPVAAA